MFQAGRVPLLFSSTQSSSFILNMYLLISNVLMMYNGRSL
jgi:hypothetical protein